MEERCCVLNVRRSVGTQSEPHHHHNGYQFLFVRQGECLVRVGQESFTVREGDLVIFSHLEIHDVQPVKEPYERYHMLLSPNHLHEEFGDRRLLGLLLNCATNGYRLNHLDTYADAADDIFRELLTEFEGNAPMREQWLGLLVKKLLLLLCRCHQEMLPEAAANETAVSGLVWSVKEYLELHCSEPLVMSLLAEKFYTSSSYLTHLFKRETGYNPKQYLQLCRLAQARMLLVESEDSVLEISQKAGFSDINNFIRYFKRETGLTPGQYRRQHSGILAEKG